MDYRRNVMRREVRGSSEKALGVRLDSFSESQSDGLERGWKKERAFLERTVNLINNSSSRTENRVFVNHFDQNTRRDATNLWVDQGNESGEVGYYDARYKQRLKHPINDWVRGIDHEVNVDRERSEFGNSCVETEVQEFKPPFGDFAGSLKSRPIMDQWDVERNGSVAFYGSGRGVGEWRRFSTSPHPDEGHSNYSNYQHNSFHGYAEQKKINDLDGHSKVENLEYDRAELLRKIDELKDQLSRSCDLTEKQSARVPVDRKMAPPPPTRPPRPPVLPNRSSRYSSNVPEGPTSLYAVNMLPFAPDKHVPEALYYNHNHGPVPCINSSGLDMQDFYPPPRNSPNEFMGYEGSYMPQRLMRPPHQPPPQYLTQPYHDHFPGQHMDFNQSTFASNWQETFSHQPACSCLQCYNKNWQIPPKVPCPIVNSRSLNDPTNPVIHHPASSVTYSPECSRGANLPHLHPLTQQPQTSSIDFDFDIGGLAHQYPRRLRVAQGSERACHPIAGGAPFLTCYSCFELLKLPRKIMVIGKNQQKVRCGACSAIILIEFGEKRLLGSIPTQLKQVSAEDDDDSAEMLDENLQNSLDCLNAGSMNCSDDYDNLGCNFQLTDTEPNVLSSEQRLNFGISSERLGHLSSSSSSSQEELNPESVNFRWDISNSADLPPKEDAPLPFPSSIHQKDSNNVSSNNVVSRYGMGNKSETDCLEKVILDRSTSRQNSVKDVSFATEMEVCFNEVPNSCSSQDSTEVSKEEEQSRIYKRSESFLTGLIKKSSRDFSESSQSVETGRPNVFVNGKPISDHEVKNAEKLAGSIQPGNYWYDYQAGFWGVMGHPCLGIIPPFIEEFNYPMPENCAAGNTGVFVNGRELYQKDLDLLAGRGLPTTRDKYYTIAFSGRVSGEYIGEELSLGKLAPTVERAKHGFGMKVPRALAP